MKKDLTGQKFNKLTAIERLANYKGNDKTYYKCICECGNERIVYGNYLTSGKIKMCEECVKKQGSSKRIDYVNQKFGKLTVLEMLYNYNNTNSTYARCICDCGNETIANMSNIKNGHTKSCGCYEKSSRYNRNNHYIDIKGQKFGMLTVIEKTDKRSTNGSMIWKCKCDCGNYTEANTSNLKRLHTFSCGCRHRSKTEILINNLLSSLNIKFEEEKRFEDCKNSSNTDMLPFDFYIKDKNLIIEYDGQHHFESIPHWGGDEKFKHTIENDNIKNQYCIDNNITLLRLPYTLKNNEIKEKILNILNP